MYVDYWIKYHKEAYHKAVRKEFITPNAVVEMLPIEQNRVAAAGA